VPVDSMGKQQIDILFLVNDQNRLALKRSRLWFTAYPGHAGEDQPTAIGSGFISAAITTVP